MTPQASSPRRHFLQRGLYQFFGRFDSRLAFLDVAHGLVRVDLFITERNQGENGFVGLTLLGGRLVLGADGFPGRDDTELVLELEHNSFGGFLSQTADLRERSYVGVD